MAKATSPVSVAGIEFDALISSDHKMEATVPEYATEKGFKISDAIILGQETLSMVLYLTNTPVTWYTRHKSNKNRVKNVCTKLEELYYKKTPVKIVTSEKVYTNMVIESITISKSVEDGYSREIPISFRKIRTTQTKTTTIPSSYGKAGKTNNSAGTANTTSGSSSSTTNSSKSSGSTNSNNSSSSSSNKGSILYNAGKSTGIIK